ncbi:MAG TPA: zinc ribbon domain-containing protein [Gammaproteobacteria bacterium]
MPTYDYRCSANDRVIEVQHRMSESLATWGELCAAAGIEPGDTPPEAPVARLATGGQVVSRKALKNPEPACGGGGCASGYCGMQ